MSRSRKESSERRRLKKLLEAVFTVCALQSTVRQSELGRIVSEARALGKQRVARLKKDRQTSVDFDALGLVIHRWQRAGLYLDDQGRPLPLQLRGRSPSIESLFREIRRGKYVDLGTKHLQQLRRVRRTRAGTFLPRDTTTIVPTLTPELFEVLAQTINHLVATVLQNTSPNRPNAIKLIERLTSIPDLPKDQVNAFKTFAREQGAALIATMDEWLESHRGRAKSRSRVKAGRTTAGLHVFGFLGNVT